MFWPICLSYFSFVVKKVTTRTEKKMAALASKIAPRNIQFTDIKFSLQSVSKMRAGKANVPMNVFNPLASVSEMKLNLQR